MRSLNTSLPRSPRRRRSNPPPEQLIQTFKAAALSVTNLYKTAAADQRRAREAGYQDALDDLLALLDKENLGLDDGEGWRVRQWATERLDGSSITHSGSDSDDERGETIKRTRSSSPVLQRSIPRESDHSRQIPGSSSPVRHASVPAPVPMAPPPSIELPTQQKPEVFSFVSAHPYPQDTDMQTSDNPSNTTSPAELQPVGQVSNTSPAVRLEVVPRGSRAGNRSSRHSSKPPGGVRSLGQGAGSKRGFRFGDYEFDLGGDGRDNSGGGGKRGRYT